MILQTRHRLFIKESYDLLVSVFLDDFLLHPCHEHSRQNSILRKKHKRVLIYHFHLFWRNLSGDSKVTLNIDITTPAIQFSLNAGYFITCCENGHLLFVNVNVEEAELSRL